MDVLQLLKRNYTTDYCIYIWNGKCKPLSQLPQHPLSIYPPATPQHHYFFDNGDVPPLVIILLPMVFIKNYDSFQINTHITRLLNTYNMILEGIYDMTYLPITTDPEIDATPSPLSLMLIFQNTPNVNIIPGSAVTTPPTTNVNTIDILDIVRSDITDIKMKFDIDKSCKDFFFNGPANYKYEISGELKIIPRYNGRYVYFSILPNMNKINIGTRKNTPAVYSIYSFHTHPSTCYRDADVDIGFPSAPDISTMIYLREHHRTLIHCIFAVEGVYVLTSVNMHVPPSPTCNYKKFDADFIKAYRAMERDKSKWNSSITCNISKFCTTKQARDGNDKYSNDDTAPSPSPVSGSKYIESITEFGETNCLNDLIKIYFYSWNEIINANSEFELVVNNIAT